jgi:hypothetical protein
MLKAKWRKIVSFERITFRIDLGSNVLPTPIFRKQEPDFSEQSYLVIKELLKLPNIHV